MQDTRGALRILELASARLCQGIAEAFGTPGNEVRTEAALARLDLWRTAWGSCHRPISASRLAALADGLPSSVAIDLAGVSPLSVFPAQAGRIVLNLLLLAAESLPDGGNVVLAGSPDDLFIRLMGAKAAWPPGFALFIADEAEAIRAMEQEMCLQAALTALLARQAGLRLSLVMPPAGGLVPPIVRLGG